MSHESNRNFELEAQLASDDGDASFEAYGAWLAERGDPRGELIALHLALGRARAARQLQRTLDLERAQREYLARFAAALDANIPGVKARWERGFWHAITVDVDQVDLARVIASPSCVALRELTLRSSNPLLDFAPLISVLAPLKTQLRALSIDSLLLRGSEEVCAGVGGFMRLEELALNNITTEALARLEGLQRLRSLSVGSSPQLRDDAIQVLCRFEALTNVDLLFTSISAAGISELQRAKPTATIRARLA